MIKNVCVLYYDAGAGHHSVAKALFDELDSRKNTNAKLVNFISHYKIPGFQNSSQSYSFTLNHFAFLYGLIVKLVDTRPVLWILKQIYIALAKPKFDKFLKDYPADIYISTCYFDNYLFDYIKQIKPEATTIMMVTDIAYPLRIWFNKMRDLIILPTKEIYSQGLKYFKDFKSQIKVMGLPVNKEFFTKRPLVTIKKELNLTKENTVLLSGGGEGMPIIREILVELDKQLTNTNIVVITGRDKHLRSGLSSKKYSNNVIIKGLTNDFAKLLITADIFITKAGAISLWEASTLKKKTIIFSYIKGQEDGNVAFAKKHFNAKYITKPSEIARQTKAMFKINEKLAGNSNINWAKEISNHLLKSD